MMRRVLAVLLLSLPLAGGCAMSFDATRVGVPVTMASAIDQPSEGQAFKVRSSAVWALWGFVPLKEPQLARALETQLVGAKEVRDLRIRVRSRWYQALITVLTLGVLVPRTVEYQGVIPGAPAPAGPAGPAPSGAPTVSPAVPAAPR
jgi:hypothetical protein